MTPIWYVICAFVWGFMAAVCYGFAPNDLRRPFARAFFASPIWPIALIAVTVVAVVKLWKSAEWGRHD